MSCAYGSYHLIPPDMLETDSLIDTILTEYRNRDFVNKGDGEEASTVVEGLVPTVIQLDNAGLPVSIHGVVLAVKTVDV